MSNKRHGNTENSKILFCKDIFFVSVTFDLFMPHRCCAAEQCDSSTTPFLLQRALVVFTDLIKFAQLSSLSSRILDSSSR